LRQKRWDLIKSIIGEEGYHGPSALLSSLERHGCKVSIQTVLHDLRTMPEYVTDMTANRGLLKMETLIAELEQLKLEAVSIRDKADIIMKIALLQRQREQLYDLLFSRQLKSVEKGEKKKMPTSISFGSVEVENGGSVEESGDVK